MKKTNKEIKIIGDSHSLHTANQLKRQQARLEKEAQKLEKNRNALFRRRIREASNKKAPKTIRTKAYYRFSKNYPAAVTPNGFRENKTQNEKLSYKKRLFVLFICLTVFVSSFIFTQFCIELSKRERTNVNTQQPNTNENLSIKAWHFTPSELSKGNTEAIISTLENNGCNMAIFEFKSEYGYIYFDVDTSINELTNKKIDSAWDTVSSLEKAGIKTCAYISCFSDTVAASLTTGMEVTSYSSYGTVFYDDKLCAWLDPFSSQSTNYLLNLIEEAYQGGFSYILLDNVRLPLAHSEDSPVFSGAADTHDGKNIALLTFINNAVRKVDKEKIILVSDLSGFTQDKNIENEKYGGTLIEANCSNFALDTRKAKQDDSLSLIIDSYKYIEEMPTVFILDACDIMKKSIEIKKENNATPYAIVDKDIKDGSTYALFAGIKNIIIW